MKKRVAIFCGASSGNDPIHIKLCEQLMAGFAREDWGLVYGGGGIGLMGALANSLLAYQGEVIGVIPEKLYTKEVAHPGLAELHVVKDMHERKQRMYQLADAFLILPGGIGTLDEFFEILTWKQIGYHAKPIFVLDHHGYFHHLLNWLDHAVVEGFFRPEHRALFGVAKDGEQTMTLLRQVLRDN